MGGTFKINNSLLWPIPPLIHPYTLNHDITEYAHYKQNKFVFDNG
jgi:hypothetical protein